MPRRFNQPPSKAELARLARLLDADDNALDLAQARGFLAAIASAPAMIMPSTWLPALFGGEPKLRSEQEAQAVFGTVMMLYNATLTALSANRLEIPDEEKIDFCLGYLEGVELDESWISDPELKKLLAPIRFLTRAAEPGGIADEDMELAAKALLGLEKLVASIYNKVFERRRLEMEDAAPAAQTSNKVGRNEPCPCGSGRKYKRCCGAN